MTSCMRVKGLSLAAVWISVKSECHVCVCVCMCVCMRTGTNVFMHAYCVYVHMHMIMYILAQYVHITDSNSQLCMRICVYGVTSRTCPRDKNTNDVILMMPMHIVVYLYACMFVSFDVCISECMKMYVYIHVYTCINVYTNISYSYIMYVSNSR